MDINRKIPIMFQQLNSLDVEDTRFIKVKIWIMHLEENYNGSYFSKEVVEQAIPSLANTPILAYIEDRKSDDEEDFSDHRWVLVRDKNGKVIYKYLGQAIGVIPESNNAKFEMRLCDDGIEREFLTVEGLVWDEKWEDAPFILKRDLIKSQSMELHKDYTGEFSDEDNLFHFTSFKFYGACCLGDEIQPAMESSTIEVQNFSFNEFNKVIQENMEKFKQFSQIINNKNEDVKQEVVNIKNDQQGGKLMNKEELLTKFSYLKGEKFEEIKSNLDNYEYEDLEKKLFSLSVKQISNAINEELEEVTTIYTFWDGCTEEIQKYYLVDILPTENIAIVGSYLDWDEYYGIPYSISGDTAELDLVNIKRYTNADWRPFVEGSDPDETVTEGLEQEQTEAHVDEDDFGCGDKKKMMSKIKEIYSLKHKEAIESIKASFSVKETKEYKTISEEYESLKKEFEANTKKIAEFELKLTNLESENNKLSEFKTSKEKEELTSNVEAIISEFSLITDDEIKDVKAKALNSEMSVEDFRKELFALEGMKLHKQFSLHNKTKEKEEVAQFNFNHKTEEIHPYAEIKHLFD